MKTIRTTKTFFMATLNAGRTANATGSYAPRGSFAWIHGEDRGRVGIEERLNITAPLNEAPGMVRGPVHPKAIFCAKSPSGWWATMTQGSSTFSSHAGITSKAAGWRRSGHHGGNPLQLLPAATHPRVQFSSVGHR
jgi:hypothetical protein